MKNILIGVFVGISVLSLSYIAYDEFIKEDKIIYKECNKNELCDECVCDNDNDNVYENEEDYVKQQSGIYSKNGKIYKLDVYKYLNENVKIEDIKINGKLIKLERKENILYVNGKKVGYVDEIYVTNNHIYTFSVAQDGLDFENIIDENANVTNLDGNKTIGKFQAYNIYLTENGEIAAVGAESCGLECTSDEEIVKLTYTNNKLEITKEKLK